MFSRRPLSPFRWPPQLPLASIFFAAVRQQAVCSFVSLTMAALANVSDLGLAQRVIDAVVPCLIDRLNSERDSEIMYTVAEALSEQARLCYESLTDGAAFSASPPSGSPGGPGISVPSAASKSDATPHTTCRISLAVAENLFKAVQLAMHDSMDRRVQSAKFIAANPDSDADDAEVLNEELAAEDDFMVNLVDTVGYVVKQHGVAIMPLVGETIGEGGWAGVLELRVATPFHRSAASPFSQASTSFLTSPRRTPFRGPFATPQSASATTSSNSHLQLRTGFFQPCYRQSSTCWRRLATRRRCGRLRRTARPCVRSLAGIP